LVTSLDSEILSLGQLYRDEAITSRPSLLEAIGRQTSHAGRTTGSHGEHDRARAALTRIADFFTNLRKTAEQLTALERWYRILSQALKKFLRGQKLVAPRQFQPAGAASYG
jgi:CRP-like cAMP-binding protein